MTNYNHLGVEELNFDDILMQEDDSICWNPNPVDQQQCGGFVEEHSLQPLQNVPFNMRESAAAAVNCENAIGRQQIVQQQQNCNFGRWQQFEQQPQPIMVQMQMQQQQPTQQHPFVMAGQHERHLWPEFNYQQQQQNTHPLTVAQTPQFQQFEQFGQPFEVGNHQFGKNSMHPYPMGQQQEMMHICHSNSTQQHHFGYPSPVSQQQLIGNEARMASTVIGLQQQMYSFLPESPKEKQELKAPPMTEKEKKEKRSKERKKTIAEKNKIMRSPEFQELVNVAMSGISCVTAFSMLETIAQEIPQFIKKRKCKKAPRKEEQIFVGLAAKKKGGKRGRRVKEYKTDAAKCSYIRYRIGEMLYKISSDEGRKNFAYMFANGSKNDGGPHIFSAEKLNKNADDQPKNGVVKQNNMKILDGEISLLALTLIIKRQIPICPSEIDQKMICLHNCNENAPKGQSCVNPFHFEIRPMTAFDKYRFKLEYGERIADSGHHSSSSKSQAHSASSSSAPPNEFADEPPEQQLMPLFFNQLHFDGEE